MNVQVMLSCVFFTTMFADETRFLNRHVGKLIVVLEIKYPMSFGLMTQQLFSSCAAYQCKMTAAERAEKGPLMLRNMIIPKLTSREAMMEAHTAWEGALVDILAIHVPERRRSNSCLRCIMF